MDNKLNSSYGRNVANIAFSLLIGLTLILTTINPTVARASAPAKWTPTATSTQPPADTATPTPAEPPLPPAVALSLQADLTYLVPGEQITFLYQISNFEKFSETTI